MREVMAIKLNFTKYAAGLRILKREDGTNKGAAMCSTYGRGI